MQVSFNGLYKITGMPENSRGRGQTIHDLSNRKIARFLEDTKKYREKDGFSYFNAENSDYYLSVRDECEGIFEDEVASYNINCYRVADHRVSNNGDSAKKEMNALSKIRTELRKNQLECLKLLEAYKKN